MFIKIMSITLLRLRLLFLEGVDGLDEFAEALCDVVYLPKQIDRVLLYSLRQGSIPLPVMVAVVVVVIVVVIIVVMNQVAWALMTIIFLKENSLLRLFDLDSKLVLLQLSFRRAYGQDFHY
jgi:hypothetical protein